MKIDDLCTLYFSLDIAPYYDKNYNKKNMEKMRDALSAVGFNLRVEDDHVALSISPDKYNRNKNRRAGRHKKVFSNINTSKLYRYSDIIWMSQTMTDSDIFQSLGMAEATYYRHKKMMKQSDYFKNLYKENPSAVFEKFYLESLPGNNAF